MRLRYLISILILTGVAIPMGGCGFFRYAVIPQSNKGPHGGAMVLIDERVSRYVEFVAMPQGEEWLLQLYAYNGKMKPRDFSSYARVDITTNSDEKVSVKLWDTKRFFLPWSRVGHLEAKVKLGDVSQFKAKASLFKSKRNFSPDELYFEYPY
ncbi:MAG: hypothetical protein A3G33_04035 [Omnitrophica bacterium RIFCSPLOWO2_12_FULL_44_17]|uniref:Uncharacterized protein n=1 Tax=Candidatus Danuiimicrobium aquiferis TaxID=1801832 RepID=A0A1G1KZD8_9BACT|nr:MAG: hypothetical protein A3B72_10240 [Omnitrophica bacterium RIFCSPHIGHO2_02_FULL_45_28]OGW91893.1 MAG: hypothetical protein A3E74_00790 [Omnitrophica bacterium RIFCSPHIGHO2_12_FULL_44_12]OGW98266.1 MAG: hypothetical protein A3G33_04035 [Omnitrophica bacterium RIFCSPLOWO2_12_FULL_44_17]OGX01829.1 MAG: hypothetical protein A3J12_06965 [Omnitrophica bacterium RIFCSPLOWO2_02_FULL_44_11]